MAERVLRTSERVRVWPGRSYPLGASWDGAGVNFALFSENATKVELCLFEAVTSKKENHRILMTEYNSHVFHCYLPDCRPGQLYGFRVHGPYEPHNGHRFNANKVVLDPYAKAVARNVEWHESMFSYRFAYNDDLNDDDNAPYCPLASVVDTAFTWANDSPPNIPWHQTVIYEAHVKGMTYLNDIIPEHLRGTYSAIAFEPVISHLKELGVTAVELMPVHFHIDDKHLIDTGKKDYWGYNTISFFAPDTRFSSSDDAAQAVQEFKTMVRILHSNDIEVILDVVYNHTIEGNHMGPTLSYRGIDNKSYYRLVEGDEKYYFDYTGCGNTLNVRNPRVLQMIMDSLRYWVEEMHVDGFRFDLASTLARTFYDVDKLGAFFDIIHQDPIISQVKLIAEPWDLGNGGYQVGNFPVLWTEWNGMFRDSVRGFWAGKGISLSEMATRMAGSSDLYAWGGRSPHASINFITCHDGFTLHDLVSYNGKHNDANGEDNRDGNNENICWNCGEEGETENDDINELRWRQKANMMTTMFLSLGVPMISGGDELSRTQKGNNNTYCQDNELNWYDWKTSENGDKEEFLDFVKALVNFRNSQPVLQRRNYLKGRAPGKGKLADVSWLHPDGRPLNNEEWDDARNQCMGYILEGQSINEMDDMGKLITGDTIAILINAHFHDIEFKMPTHRDNKPWVLRLYTFRDSGLRPGHLWQGGDPFPLKSHSIAVFTLYRVKYYQKKKSASIVAL